jgi:hypothetical protein
MRAAFTFKPARDMNIFGRVSWDMKGYLGYLQYVSLYKEKANPFL